MAIKDFMMYGVTKVKIPKYMREILENVEVTQEPYGFILRGVNQNRPAYGIYKDMEKIKKWAEMNHAGCEVIKYNEERKNYFVHFHMTDPTACIVEKIVKERKEKAGWR